MPKVRKEMLTVRVDVAVLDRMDAALLKYKRYLYRTGDERTVNRSEMVRDIIEFGLDTIEKRS